ncbi:podocalyxin isoform X1 [Gymnogyps californianus]|uniref:podocalyxin isoform X1 n=1 Tax=Gymnogyps californianus TaxID=33616 RepID=UPI0021CAB345|nr:podocalyxin isoform X1 [Gymnogyps californianus]
MQGITHTSNPGNPSSTSAMSPATVQETTPTNNPASPPSTPVISPTTVQGTTRTSNPGNPQSTPATSPATVQGITLTNNLGNPPPAPTTSPHSSQQVSSSISSGTSTAAPAATSSAAQQTTSPPASLGSSAATTAANPIPTHVSSPPATPGGLGTAVTSPPTVEAQRSQPSHQLTSTAASTGVPRSDLPTGLKDYGVSSPTSVTKQPHSSSSSPVQGLASSTRPGSIDTSVTSVNGSVSPTTSKASLSLPPGSIDKVSEAATTTTPGADQSSHDARSVSTKPASADQSPASAQPSAPAPGDQTASSSPGHQHPNASFQNEVICKDQVQNDWPIMYLKEAKTCAEWRTASVNISFFESFCSTGQHAFNASRETCTVMLTSSEPRSQRWAVQAVVHLPLDPEKVLQELKEKDKLEELGIVNITYDKMEREMIINDEFSTPLIITIVTLAGSLLLIAAIYGCCHQRFSQKKDQHIHPDLPGFDDGHVALIFNQRLTEELQTMENGYHDNPTLEVMETSSEMQEKKVNLNGELGDSWIVPLDTLMKEDLEEEEDTHL